MLKFIGGCQILKATAEEVEWLFGIDRKTAMDRPYAVLKSLGPGAIGVLVTDGDGGVAYAFGTVGGRMDAFTVPCVDSTGAGDAFLAGFIHKAQVMTDEWQQQVMSPPPPRLFLSA